MPNISRRLMFGSGYDPCPGELVRIVLWCKNYWAHARCSPNFADDRCNIFITIEGEERAPTMGVLVSDEPSTRTCVIFTEGNLITLKPWLVNTAGWGQYRVMKAFEPIPASFGIPK